eukprot:gene3325-biopygen422
MPRDQAPARGQLGSGTAPARIHQLRQTAPQPPRSGTTSSQGLHQQPFGVAVPSSEGEGRYVDVPRAGAVTRRESLPFNQQYHTTAAAESIAQSAIASRSPATATQAIQQPSPPSSPFTTFAVPPGVPTTDPGALPSLPPALAAGEPGFSLLPCPPLPLRPPVPPPGGLGAIAPPDAPAAHRLGPLQPGADMCHLQPFSLSASPTGGTGGAMTRVVTDKVDPARLSAV